MRRVSFKRLRDRRGVSLIEALIGVVILAVALLGLAASGGVAARQVYMGRTDMDRWTALQQQMEVLIVQGYYNVADGSVVVQGYPMDWTVSGTDPKKIALTIERENFAGQTVQQTIIMYLANPGQ